MSGYFLYLSYYLDEKRKKMKLITKQIPAIICLKNVLQTNISTMYLEAISLRNYSMFLYFKLVQILTE